MLKKITITGTCKEMLNKQIEITKAYENNLLISIDGFAGNVRNWNEELRIKRKGLYELDLVIELEKYDNVCMNKIHNLEINKDATLFDMMVKFNEEIKEVYEAVNNLDKENFIEELLDVVQVCYGLAYTQNINLDDYIKQHNEKLLSRGHKFID